MLVCSIRRNDYPSIGGFFLLLALLPLLLTCSSPVQPLFIGLSAPETGAWVEGVIPVTANVGAGGSFTRFELLVDGQVVATANTSAVPHTFLWDTRATAPDSTAPTQHTVQVRGHTSDDRQKETNLLSVFVLHPKRLTVTPDIDIQPEWSHDGTKIIFKSNRLSPDPVQSFKIYTMTATGVNQTQIVTDRDYHGYPDWSPDETQVVFNSFDPGNSDVFTASVATGVSRQITADASFDDSGRWSPDGTRIVFFSTRTGSSELYLAPVTLDGAPNGSLVRLTTNTIRDEQPRWAPDGTRLVFESNRTGQMKVYTLPAAGGGATQITNASTGADGYPNWSADSRYLTFDSESNDNRDLYLIPASGGTPRRITWDSAYDEHPSWSPDGRKIAFASNRSGNMDIWIVEIPPVP